MYQVDSSQLKVIVEDIHLLVLFIAWNSRGNNIYFL